MSKCHYCSAIIKEGETWMWAPKLDSGIDDARFFCSQQCRDDYVYFDAPGALMDTAPYEFLML